MVKNSENLSNGTENKFDEIPDATQNVTTKRKRGRPRKTLNVNKSKASTQDAKHSEKNKGGVEDEIILHLPITMSDINKLGDNESDIMSDVKSDARSDTKSDTRSDNKSNGEDQHKSDIFTINDMSYPSSDDSFEELKNNQLVNKKIKDMQEKIISLEKQVVYYKKSAEDNLKSGIIDNNIYKMDIDFVSTKNNKSVVVDKTDVSCWWCAHQFDNPPCFIPEKFVDDKYYVFGCFCSYNCAAAYNLSMTDYKVWDRYSLIKRLYNTIYNNTDDVPTAPSWKTLEKFGGVVTIDEFRNNSKTNDREYRFIMPPLVSIVPLIEVKNKNCGMIKRVQGKDDLVLKRTRPLPSSKNTLVETMGISIKRKN